MINEYSVLSPEMLYFKLVYEQKGLNRAARKVSQDPAHLSRIIARLEQKTGAKLFIRHKSGLSPTEAADRLHAAIKGAQSEFSQAFAKKDGKLKRIRIGFASAIGYSHFSKSFLERIVSLGLQPEFTLGSSMEIVERMKSRELDFALVNDAIKFPGLVARKVASEGLVLCSVSGEARKNLLIHSDMLGLETIIHSLVYESRWVLNDYFLLAKFLAVNSNLMGILPETIAGTQPVLKIVRRLDRAGRITALSWPGSLGVELMQSMGMQEKG